MPRITVARARAIFRAERARFAAVYPRAARATLTIVDAECLGRGTCASRDLAECFTDTGEVRLLRRALTSEARATALIRHELSHVSDARIRERGKEQRADDIAERVTGERIFYDREGVQTRRRGTYPRPRDLHR